MDRKRTLTIILCLLLALGLSAMFVVAEGAGDLAPDYVHLPIVEQDEQSPSGLKTTWSCVYFGSYPSAEVVDGSWEAVDDYALREGDLIRDEVLFARLEAEDWQDNTVNLDGEFYYRVGLDSVPASSGVREQDRKSVV